MDIDMNVTRAFFRNDPGTRYEPFYVGKGNFGREVE